MQIYGSPGRKASDWHKMTPHVSSQSSCSPSVLPSYVCILSPGRLLHLPSHLAWPPLGQGYACLPARPISALCLPRCCGCGPPGASVTDSGVGLVGRPVIVQSPSTSEPRGGMWPPRGLLSEALHPHVQALCPAIQPCLYLQQQHKPARCQGLEAPGAVRESHLPGRVSHPPLPLQVGRSPAACPSCSFSLSASLSGPDGLQIPYSYVSLLGPSMLVSMAACATPTLTETEHLPLVSLPV